MIVSFGDPSLEEMKGRNHDSGLRRVLLTSSLFVEMGKIKEYGWRQQMGMFSVASLFLSMTGDVLAPHAHVNSLWRIKTPPRVIGFGRLALLGGILTMDNLRRRRVMTVNACPMCLADEETVDHLLVNFKAAQYLWKLILGWFKYNGLIRNSLPSLFEYWKLGVGSKGGKTMSKFSFLAVIWTIWKERNRRCFEGLSSNESQMGEKIKHLVATWALCSAYPSSKEYQELQFYTIGR